MPNLKGKSRDDVIRVLDGLSLKYQFKGEGAVIKQNPEPGVEVDINSNVEVEFSNIEG